MKAKRRLTLSITLVAALLMALLTTSAALAGPGSEEIIDVEGTVLGWSEVDFTIDLEVVIVSDPPVDPPLTEVLTILVGEDFDFTTIAVGDILAVSGFLNEEGILVVTDDVKIQDRIRDRTKTQECEGEECDPYFCAVDTEKVHPVAEKIALTYGVPYETILGLLCEGDVSLGQIMLALQTAALTGEEDFTIYLTGDMDEFHWGQIWQEFDITGKPDKGIPPGEIQKGEKSEEGEGNGEQGPKNNDSEEDSGGFLGLISKWLQKGKK